MTDSAPYETPDNVLAAGSIPGHRKADWTTALPELNGAPKTCLSCKHFLPSDDFVPRCALWEERWNADRTDAGHEIAATHSALVCDEWDVGTAPEPLTDDELAELAAEHDAELGGE